MRETLDFEKASINIKNKQPHLTLLEFDSIHTVAKFKDKDYGLFEGKYRSVLYGAKCHYKRHRHKDKGCNKLLLSFEDASKQISDKFDYLTLIEYSGSNKLAKFIDSKYGEFEKIFKYVRDEESRHPERSRVNKINAAKNPSRLNKQKKTNLKKYNTEYFFNTKEFKDKKKSSMLERFGKEFHNELTFKDAEEKLIKNNIPYKLIKFSSPVKKAVFLDEEFGEFSGIFDYVCYGDKKHPKRAKLNRVLSSKNPERINKIRETNLKKYGYESILSVPSIIDKIKDTNLKKYGYDNPAKSKAVRNKINKTILKKYGVTSIFNNKSISDKIKRNRIKNGSTRSIDGLSITEYILKNNMDISYSRAKVLLDNSGKDCLKNYKKNRSNLETLVGLMLNEEGLTYNKNTTIQYDKKRYFTDITVGNKLIIECDGIYFHSECKIKNKDYHKNKSLVYNKNGYRSLFFRSDEIYNKSNIVKSIILAKLKLSSNKIYARSCTIQEINISNARQFFDNNHLDGYGSGKTFGLIYNEEIVCAITISKRNNNIEITRFCNKLNTVVIGGLSKLISHIIKVYGMNIYCTIDMRYGDGESLIKLGFQELSNKVSYRWTDFKNTYFKDLYRNNSGYDSGLYKIYDCGQKRFKLLVSGG